MRVALIAPNLRVEESFRYTSEYLFLRSGNNTGNFAFVYALWSHLAPDVQLFPWHASPRAIRSSCDVVVMACANQLGPHTDLGILADMLEQASLPIVAIGLGAQAKDSQSKIELTAGTKRWLDVIVAHAPSERPNIGVRGEFSLQQVERYGAGDRAAITGCPSNLINTDPGLPAKLGEKYRAAKIERVAATAGLHLWPQLKLVEQALADLVEITSGVYVAQSELDMIRLARGEFDRIEPKIFEILREYIRPNLSNDQFRRWCRRYATCFNDAASWMESMRKFDFVVGPRFHGVMLAMQAGTPGGVIAHDSRTFEMCETMCIPVCKNQDLPARIDLETLGSLFAFEPLAYERRRTELGRRYANILRSAGIEPSAAIADLLESDAAPEAQLSHTESATASSALS